MKRTLRLGISTCPNDVFAFRALLEGHVAADGLDLRFELRDVQELNERLATGALDAAKVSFFAALQLANSVGVLRSGSALGFGVGPVLLAARPGLRPGDRVGSPPRPVHVLCPGTKTTATLLYHLFHPGQGDVEQRVFSDIMPALERGEADLGVCIHEGRFTWQRHGLHLVEDLGATWEERTKLPLPLGGVCARRDLRPDVVSRLQQAVLASLDHALAHKEDTLPAMRRHAQELDDDAIWSHVDLYVNAWTRDLGEPGSRALDMLAAEARRAGLLPAGTPPLRILP